MDIDHSFDFANYLSPVDNLDQLAEPFSHEEINKVVAAMPNDKAPRGLTVLLVSFSKFVGQSLNMISISCVRSFGMGM
jgi:hypothetical protein